MSKITPHGEMKILAQANIGALVVFPVIVETKDGKHEKMFEKFVRPPGTRIIAVKDRTIFLQKEFRLESSKGYEWRLPGGKVMDSFEEYKPYIGTEVPEKIILEAGKKELHEEAQMEAKDIKIFKKSECGALVEWDLYYLVAENITQTTHRHENEEGEEIIDGQWFSFEEILAMCKDREIDEDRTVAALYQFVMGV